MKAQAFTVSKYDDYRNEDAFELLEAKGRFVLSDGASVSYDSANWAKVLCKQYVDEPRVDGNWIERTRARFRIDTDRCSLPWFKQAAFDQGSFATLLGLTLSNKGTASIVAIGDSTIFWKFSDCDEVTSFPSCAPENFGFFPDLISTNPSENIYLDGPRIEGAKRSIKLPHGKVFFIMATDSVAEWLSSEVEKKFERLSNLESNEMFAELVNDERQFGHIKRDDSTVLAIVLRNGLSDGN